MKKSEMPRYAIMTATGRTTVWPGVNALSALRDYLKMARLTGDGVTRAELSDQVVGVLLVDLIAVPTPELPYKVFVIQGGSKDA